MDEQHNVKLDAIKQEIENLSRQLPTLRDFERLDTEIRFLREQLNNLRNTIDTKLDISVDFTPVNDQLTSLGRDVAHLEKKTPPLASLVGALFIIIAAVGGSFYNILNLNEPIGEIEATIDAIVKNVADTTTALDQSRLVIVDAKNTMEKTRLDLERERQNVISETKILTDEIKTVRDELGDAIKMVGSFETIVTRVIAEFSQISLAPTASTVVTSGTTPDAGSITERIVAQLGDDAPRHIALLVEANRHIKEG